MIASPLTIVKVGGSLLDSADDVERVARAVAARRHAGQRLAVVVSALHGVTDLLEEATERALDPRSGGEMVRDVMDRLAAKHETAMSWLPDRDALRLDLRVVLDGVERLLTGIRLTGELTERTRDLVLAQGERLSAPLLAAGVVAAGSDARSVTSEEAGLRAVGPFRVGTCVLDACREGLAALDHELHDRVLVLTGFYALDEAGDVILLGRGGTDYTAGVVAAAMDAASLELWKDVPGFLSADPNAVPGARLLPEISFDEACELGYYGARILNPRCLEPLRGRAVDVSLRSIFDTERVGTRLVPPRGKLAGRVAALAARRGAAVIHVHGAAMVNHPGVAGTILGAMGAAGVNVDAVASAMTALSFALADADVPRARRALRQLEERGEAGVEQVTVHREAALLGVVGDAVATDATVAARMLTCLAAGDIPVHLISHGPGDVSVSCAIPGYTVEPAMAALHAVFFPEREADPTSPDVQPAARGTRPGA